MLRSVALVCAGALAINAQTSTGEIFGVVRDSSGGAVPAAGITATRVDTSISGTRGWT